MAIIRPQGRDAPEKTNYIYGFQKGVNTLQDNSLIDDHELSAALNMKLVVDGVKKREGTINFGSASGSRVYGGTPYYTSATSSNSFIIREGGTSLMYYDTANAPTAISGATMTTGKRTEFVMARDTLYVENGTDPLIKITVSGGVPVATTFTALTTPVGVSVTPTGSAGTTNYSYRISAYNATGETLASVSVATTTGNATLTSSNYNAVAWTAVASAVGYNIYGRKGAAFNGVGETKLATSSTNSYSDTGTDTASAIITPPEGNSTGGQKGSMIIYALGRLFVAGDTTNPSRMSYSGSGTQIDDFSTAYSGGWVDISKNDGDSITAIYFYQNTIIVFKHRSAWKFSFTSTGLPQVELITNEVGCESYRSVKIVNNDLWFLAKKDGKAAIYSLGNVANYFNSLRTTEKSLEITGGSYLDSANIGQLANASSFYYRGVYGLCVATGSSTTNDTVFPYDSHFGAWLGKWTNIKANAFFPYLDSTGSENLYYCSETTGYIVKMFTGSDDNGTAVSWQIKTKNFMQNYFDQYKIFRNPVLWFKDVVGGGLTGYIINDGIFTSSSFNITPIVSGIGSGFDIPGGFLAGDSQGAAGSSGNSDQPMELILTKIARSLQIELDDANAISDFKFLGMSYKWLLLEGKPLPATNRIRVV